MEINEGVLKLVGAFYNYEIDDLNLYIEGFGGLFLRRTKDAIVMGYTDKRKRFGKDDHVTLFVDNYQMRGLHRKVSDAETDVYMRYNIDYFQSPEGIRKLAQDMQKGTDVPIYMKPLLLLLYNVLNVMFHRAQSSCRDIRILEDSEARRLGMKSPCIFAKLGYIERLTLPIYGDTIVLQSFIHALKFREKSSNGFTEQRFPGSHVTKHPRKEKNC